MKIEKTKLGDCRVKLVIDAGPDETKADYDKAVKAYIRQARIPGFRQGKAPLSVIQKFLGAELLSDVKNALVSRLSSEAVKSEGIEVANIVSIDDVVFSPERGINFSATIDIRPEIKLPKYQKIPVSAGEVKVDEGEVDAEIDYMRKSLSPRKDVEDAVQKGDVVKIDFKGEIGGVPLAEAKPEADKHFAGENGHWASADPAEGDHFIPGLADAITGKKVGDAFAFEADFPSEFRDKALAGVKVSYSGTVQAVRRTEPLADEDLAKYLGQESFEKMRGAIRDRYLARNQEMDDMRMNSEIRDWLAKKSSFAVPESIVSIRLGEVYERVIREEVQKANAQDPTAYAREHASDIAKIAEERARRDVLLGYVFEGIAKEQSISVDEHELTHELDAISRYYIQQGDKTMTPKRVREIVERNGRIELIRQSILESKVLKYLRDEIRAAK
ncbi:MAG: trigger factor [Kiritimatiellae bacterium]|nr:trigger factor [Kiritimatiellia bacterium]